MNEENLSTHKSEKHHNQNQKNFLDYKMVMFPLKTGADKKKRKRSFAMEKSGQFSIQKSTIEDVELQNIGEAISSYTFPMWENYLWFKVLNENKGLIRIRKPRKMQGLKAGLNKLLSILKWLQYWTGEDLYKVISLLWDREFWFTWAQWALEFSILNT